MKILVNGNTVTEMISEKIVKVRDFKRNEIIECDFVVEDMSLVEKALDHIKTNKVMYTRLVVLTALMLHFNMNFVFANDLSKSLDSLGYTLLSMLNTFAKWGCITMGVKNMTITMIQGGDFKEALKHGTSYLLGFLFIQFYPQLFEMFSGIKF